MPLVVLLLVLSIPVSAQTLPFEQDFSGEVKRLNNAWRTVGLAGDWEAAQPFRDSSKALFFDKKLQAVYLTDDRGQVWNLGVMDQPFLLHVVGPVRGDMAVFAWRMMNDNAEAFANDIVSFALLPTTQVDTLYAKLPDRSDDLHVIPVSDTLSYSRGKIRNNLFGMISYPATVYIRSDLSLAGLQTGVSLPHPAADGAKAVDATTAHKRNTKRLAKATRRLLRGRRIRD